MKNKIIFTVFALLIYASGANAQMCTTTTTDTPAGHIPAQAQEYISNCKNLTYINYYEGSLIAFSTPICTSCKRGYNLFSYKNEGLTSWADSCHENVPVFTICAKPCDNSCIPDSNFDYDRDGVESFVDRYCIYDETICETKTYYQCASGYYGEAKSDFTGCAQCPHPNNDEHYNASTVPGEATSITDCFLPVNSTFNSFNDGTGTYACAADAYYKQ